VQKLASLGEISFGCKLDGIHAHLRMQNLVFKCGAVESHISLVLLAVMDTQNVLVTDATRGRFHHLALFAENSGYADGGLVIGSVKVKAWA
jgi:hypothetical protein